MRGEERNKPCPCGSGLKFKKCCGVQRRVGMSPSAPGAPLHQLDERLVDKLRNYATSRWGMRWFEEAISAYFGDFETRPDPADLQLFMPWVVHHWNVAGRPIREWFLEERSRSLTREDAEWLRAQSAVVLTLWEVLEVRRGMGVRVKDLLGQEEHFVQEVKGSQLLYPRDVVLARVVELAGVTVFCGMYPRSLPPMSAHAFVKTVRRQLRAPRHQPVSRDTLRAEDTTLGLILRWRDEVESLEEQARQIPRLSNTDGDPFVIVEDHYTLSAGVRPHLEERLASLEGADEPEDGEEGEVIYTFLKEGNAMHPTWQNTIIGRAILQRSLLRLETNSVKRADALRQRVEAACQGLLPPPSRTQTESSQLREKHPPPLREPPTPERSEAARALKEEHYAAWPDMKLPHLRNRSPRQAVKTAAGRQEVDALLKQLENFEAHQPEAERVDVTPLRRELGLEG